MHGNVAEKQCFLNTGKSGILINFLDSRNIVFLQHFHVTGKSGILINFLGLVFWLYFYVFF